MISELRHSKIVYTIHCCVGVVTKCLYLVVGMYYGEQLAQYTMGFNLPILMWFLWQALGLISYPAVKECNQKIHNDNCNREHYVARGEFRRPSRLSL